jgi:DNA-binding NarL/FixJ family response regulator
MWEERRMFQQVSLSNGTVGRTLSLLCGITHLTELTKNKLSSLGFYIVSSASTKLVLDLPVGYGLSVLKSLKNDHEQVIMVTWSPCQEYLEDLWDLKPAALLAGEILQKQSLIDTLSEVMDRVSKGERYRLTSGPSTPLTRCERLVLHHIAQGSTNSDVARQLHVEQQTVKNTLRSVYRKLQVCNHVEATLYYWGMLYLFEMCDNFLA